MDKKKIVLITGGASGIGFGTIEYLLEQRNYEIISVSRGEKNIALAKEKYFMEYEIISNNKQNLLTTEHILCYYEYNN